MLRRVDFFDDLPVEPKSGWPDDDYDVPDTPEWVGPPGEVMAGVVPLEDVVFRDDHVFIGIAEVRAFSTGVTFTLHVAARRGNWPRERWEHVEESFWDGERRTRRRPGVPGDGLRIGIELADGRRAGTSEQHELWSERDTPPTQPVLTRNSGGGSGGPRGVEARHDVWLWPLPAGDAFDVVVAWPTLDVPVTRYRIACAPVHEAAQRARPYWPGPD